MEGALCKDGVPVDSPPESVHVPEEVFDSSEEESLVASLLLQLLEEDLLRLFFVLGCLFFFFWGLFLAVLEGLE